MFNGLTINECITWLNDVPRNSWYRNKIKNLVKDKVVFEVGCGSGILAAYCLEFGAKHYYGIDIRNHRADYTRKILDKLGYQNKHTIVTGNFLELQKFDNKIDILLVEQTGNQYQNNFMIKQIWKHAQCLFPYDFISLPDRWNLDIWIYEGCIESYLDEQKISKLLYDPSLPKNYYQAVQSLNSIQPVQKIKNAITLNIHTCGNNIKTEIDNLDYKNVTLLLDDFISFNDSICYSSSAVSDWPAPLILHHTCTKKSISLSWDHDMIKEPNFYRGFWKVE